MTITLTRKEIETVLEEYVNSIVDTGLKNALKLVDRGYFNIPEDVIFTDAGVQNEEA